MSEVIHVSKSQIERKRGPLRIAHLPGESQPVVYSVHGAIAEHYKVDPSKLKESHASAIDYVISATAGWSSSPPRSIWWEVRRIDSADGDRERTLANHEFVSVFAIRPLPKIDSAHVTFLF